MFFAAGPVEQAIGAKNFGFDPVDPQQQGMVGFGSFERTMSTLERHIAGGEFVCGERFTMADVYVGSMVDWGLNFGIMPPNVAFVSYVDRLRERAAYQAAKAIDNKLIEEMKK
jgi:glutathione S-transferase